MPKLDLAHVSGWIPTLVVLFLSPVVTLWVNQWLTRKPSLPDLRVQIRSPARDFHTGNTQQIFIINDGIASARELLIKIEDQSPSMEINCDGEEYTATTSSAPRRDHACRWPDSS